MRTFKTVIYSGPLFGTALTRTYRYNGKGERVSKTVAAGNTNNRYYTYDESGHLLGEYLASGVRVQEYVWMDDTLVAVLSDHDATTYQYVQTDHLGTPRAVINPVNNAIIWRWNLTNSAFGEHAPVADPDGNAVSYTFNLRYPGQWYDTESKLHYNYFRDYDPNAGRYIESDPLGVLVGSSTYAYAGSESTGAFDSLGLKAELILFDQSTKSSNTTAATNYNSGPGQYTVAGHGAKAGKIQLPDGEWVKPDVLARMILSDMKKNHRGKKFDEIVLLSCNLGRENQGWEFAQLLSSLTGLKVTAPDNFIFLRENGTYWLGDADPSSMHYVPGTTGNMVTFCPSGACHPWYQPVVDFFSR